MSTQYQDKTPTSYHFEAGPQKGRRLWQLGLLVPDSSSMWFWEDYYYLDNGMYIVSRFCCFD